MSAKKTVYINFEDYRDKVLACWIGKNIGGTMGGPYEGTHEFLDIQGFATAPGKPLPNDDLDLQLIWLHAMEKIGPRGINAMTLGELWNSYITAEWNEYGVAKINMKAGLVPPLSGEYKNAWANSNGSWIRTEIWATLMPGCPDMASKYATEDAKVDHGAGEGKYASAFVAFMQSAAFVIADLNKCIDLALNAIPEDCRTAKSIRLAIECYKKNLSLFDARNAVQKANSDMADGWFEAPSNVAYAILGMLYGEGDFKKSMINAINCGDDTDCTAATVGATLGILGGMKSIPEDLRTHIGDEIITIAIDKTNVGASLPKSCSALTERIVTLCPHILFTIGSNVEFTDQSKKQENLYSIIEEKCNISRGYCIENPFTARYTSPLFSADVQLEGGPDILPNEAKKVKITFSNNIGVYDAENYFLNFRWWLPDGFSVNGKSSMILRNVVTARHDISAREVEFTITASENIEPTNRCVLEVTALGRPTALYIPILFLA